MPEHRRTHRNKRSKCFHVRRNGFPIRKHYLPAGINAKLTYNKSFAEADACIAAGLDYYEWRSDNYPQEFKSEVVAWHQMSLLIKAHVSSAEAKAMKKSGKKKGKK